MKTQTIFRSLLVGVLMLFTGAVALPVQAQKTITMSFEKGALKDGESLSRSAFRNRAPKRKSPNPRASVSFETLKDTDR